MVVARGNCYTPLYCIEDFHDSFWDFSPCGNLQNETNYQQTGFDGCFHQLTWEVFPLPGEWIFPWEIYDFYVCAFGTASWRQGKGGRLNDKDFGFAKLFGTHGDTAVEITGAHITPGQPNVVLIAAQKLIPHESGKASSAAGMYEVVESCNSALVGTRFQINKYDGQSCLYFCYPNENNFGICDCTNEEWNDGQECNGAPRAYTIAGYNHSDWQVCGACNPSSPQVLPTNTFFPHTHTLYEYWDGSFHTSGIFCSYKATNWHTFENGVATVHQKYLRQGTFPNDAIRITRGTMFTNATRDVRVAWWTCAGGVGGNAVTHMYINPHAEGSSLAGTYFRVNQLDFWYYGFPEILFCNDVFVCNGSGPDTIDIG